MQVINEGMKLHISKCEDKNADWKVVGVLTDANVAIEDVSVNRTNKKGEVFPGFDTIRAGAEVEGTLWQSSTGKYYLFAPDPAKAKPAGAMAGMKAAQERKAEGIKEAQENKNMSIMIAAAFRDATLILNEMFPDIGNEPNVDVRLDAAMEMHRRIKDRYIKEWGATEKSLDVPF